MQLVATIKETSAFFRAQSVSEEEIELVKQAMQNDTEQELEFQVMSDADFETWLTAQ